MCPRGIKNNEFNVGLMEEEDNIKDGIWHNKDACELGHVFTKPIKRTAIKNY